MPASACDPLKSSIGFIMSRIIVASIVGCPQVSQDAYRNTCTANRHACYSVIAGALQALRVRRGQCRARRFSCRSLRQGHPMRRPLILIFERVWLRIPYSGMHVGSLPYRPAIISNFVLTHETDKASVLPIPPKHTLSMRRHFVRCLYPLDHIVTLCSRGAWRIIAARTLGIA
jgi:hypothetical protein